VRWLCTSLGDLAGAGSETTNSLTGVIAKADGSPAPNALVQLIPDTYDCVKDSALPASLRDTTDGQGKYRFTNVDTGTYTVQATGPAERTRAMVTGVHAIGDTVTVPLALLHNPGTIKVVLPDSVDKVMGYLYAPGTTIFSFLNNGNGFAVLDSAPSGVIPAIYYSSTNSSAAIVIRYNVTVSPGDTAVVWNPAWKCARKLCLNTVSTGAGTAGDVYGFPILVRLTSGNFSFGQAKSGGADLRFTKPDNAFLPYEIERWDPANGAAEIWVKTDTIHGYNDSQYIVMYWDNATAADSSNNAAVFDTTNGFAGVWHLGEAGNTTAYDATINHYDGTPSGMSAASAVPGIIGKAQDFNGTSNYIAMLNTASSKLNFQENGSYMMSLWVYADTIDATWRAIAGKGHEQYYMQLKNFGNGRATWEFVEFQNQSGWDFTEDSVPPAPGSGTWLNLVGVRSGTSQRLYINGELVVDTQSLMAGAYSRVTSDNFTVGRFSRIVTLPYYQGWSYFNGKIDEVRVSSTVPTADWIKLCYMNQRAHDKLVEFR
jgi:hypothetical protein